MLDEAVIDFRKSVILIGSQDLRFWGRVSDLIGSLRTRFKSD